MKFSVAAVLAFAATAFAQTADFDPIFTPASGEVVPAGQTFKITWQAPAKYAGQKISISLIGGATQATQVPLQDIASGVDNSAESYEWTVDASLGAEAFYGLVFKLDSDPNVFQYSNPFKIDGSAVPVSSSTGSATTTLTATTGVKTVILSSSSSIYTSAAVTTKVGPVTTDIIIDVTTTVPCNGTTPAPVQTKTAVTTIPFNCTTLSTAAKPPVVVTPTAGVTPTKGSPATPTGTEPVQVTAGASRIGAGSLAAVAGLVLAAFAL